MVDRNSEREKARRKAEATPPGEGEPQAICQYCGKLQSTHYQKDDNGDFVRRGVYLSEFIRIPCREQVEFEISVYYDDAMKRAPESRPAETPLVSLYKKNELGFGVVSNGFVVSDYPTFIAHLKTFIKYVVWDCKDKKFSHHCMSVPDLRTIKLTNTGNNNFNQFDQYRVLIFDLSVQSHTYVTDIPFMKELMTYRERMFLSTWFVNPTTTVTNRNLEDPEIVGKIHSLERVDLATGAVRLSSASAIVEGSGKKLKANAAAAIAASAAATARAAAKKKQDK
jgi:hypothetical protein